MRHLAEPLAAVATEGRAATTTEPGRDTLTAGLRSPRRRPNRETAQEVADSGTRGSGGPLPYLDLIQAAFGAHDVSSIEAHVGGDAAESADALGAEAYATGGHVAFGGAPSLFTAAHEAAHVIQGRDAGVQLLGGIGPEDSAAETHADAVAEAVVAGKPVEALLDRAPALAGSIHRNPLVSEPDEAPLEATPGSLTFTMDGPTQQSVELTNTHHVESVVLDRVMSLGGPGFDAALGAGRVLKPQGQVNLDVQFDADAYTGQRGWVDVYTRSGERTGIPLNGPPASELVNRGKVERLALQAFPDHVSFGDSLVGFPRTAEIELRNPTLEDHVLERIEVVEAGQAPSLMGPPAPSSFVVTRAQMPRKLAKNYETTIAVMFTPTSGGNHSANIFLWGSKGRLLGMVSVEGDGIAGKSNGNEPAQEPVQVDASCKATTDAEKQELLALRMPSSQIVGRWRKAAHKTIEDHHHMLRDEWIEFLGMTSSNPTFSRTAVPGPEFLTGLLQNTVGNVIAIGPEALAEHVTKKLVARAATKAGAGVAGAAVGGMAGPAGAVVGFVVGTLVETIVGFLFAEQDAKEVRELVQKAYQQGHLDGAVAAVDAIKKRLPELDGAKTKADKLQDDRIESYEALINSSCDPKRVEHLLAEIEALAELAVQPAPKKGFANQLLAVWVRDHAADGEKPQDNVMPGEWEKATERLGEEDPDHFAGGQLLNQPDLWVGQAATEWEKRGLPMVAGLRERVLNDIGMPARDAEPGEAGTIAGNAQKMYSLREFIWPDARMNLAHWRMRNGTPEAEHFTYEGFVSCRLNLVVQGGTCAVEAFMYKVFETGKADSVTTKPGNPDAWLTYQGKGEGYKSEAAIANQLYGTMSKLQGSGLAVDRTEDAATNEWLKGTFGGGVAIPRTQHADGREEPVTVFKVEGQVYKTPQYSCGKPVPGTVGLNRQTWDSFYSLNQTKAGDYLMVRAGDVILVLEMSPNLPPATVCYTK